MSNTLKHAQKKGGIPHEKTPPVVFRSSNGPGGVASPQNTDSHHWPRSALRVCAERRTPCPQETPSHATRGASQAGRHTAMCVRSVVSADHDAGDGTASPKTDRLSKGFRANLSDKAHLQPVSRAYLAVLGPVPGPIRTSTPRRGTRASARSSASPPLLSQRSTTKRWDDEATSSTSLPLLTPPTRHMSWTASGATVSQASIAADSVRVVLRSCFIWASTSSPTSRARSGRTR